MINQVHEGYGEEKQEVTEESNEYEDYYHVSNLRIFTGIVQSLSIIIVVLNSLDPHRFPLDFSFFPP